MAKNITVAICYDFDGTPSPTNMQEYDFLPVLGIKPDEFWNECSKKAKMHKADPIPMYMKTINEFVADEDRPVPFSRIIYVVGDGTTDIPCMKLVKDRGGYSIAVYAQWKKGKKEELEKLVRDGRANFIAVADYREGSVLDNLIKSIIVNLSTKYKITFFEKK